jgi:hypothetical protein
MKYAAFLLVVISAFFPAQMVHAAFGLTAAWDTGDINTRASYPIAAYDREHTGTSDHYVAPIQHGVKSFDKNGTFEWSYAGITNGYDVRDIEVGDLQGTGYNDTIVVGSGYYSASADGRIAILDKDGTQIQLITEADFGTPTVQSLALDGTTIYAGTSAGTVEKFVKSGSTWVQDTSSWPEGPGGSYVTDVTVADLGNGPRVIFSVFASPGDELWVYNTDGTLDWSANVANYTSVLAVGNVDSSVSGNELVVGYQGGIQVFDKDGNAIGTITTGTNVRESVTLYDSDANGEDEIYYTDMGNDLWSFERTGTHTYTQKYSLADQTPNTVVTHYDIDGDGQDEIILGTTDGYLKVLSADLSVTKASINIGQGTIGGFYQNFSRQPNGIIFSDIDGDGHADILVSASNGYMFAYEASGFPAAGGGGDATPHRTMRLFEGYTIKLLGGKLIIYGQ